MSEPAAPYAVPASPAPAHAPLHGPQASQAALRCFDAACLVHEACPFWQRRHGPLTWPVAGTWRLGWEERMGLCRKAALDIPVPEAP